MAQTVEVEQPAYEVLAAVGSIEIRQYGPRLAAEADMGPGAGIEAEQEAAFMTLAAFIFGQNRQGPAVAMTAPVAVEPLMAPIAMTAPVAMKPGERGRVMRFFMPAEYTLETLARPGDNRVRIATVPAQTLAVLRFSGEADDEQVTSRKAELLAGLRGSSWEPAGEPGFFGYDPPMTPPELRRNEVFVEVAAASSAAFGEGKPREAGVTLTAEVLALIRQPGLCFLATSMPDGSPQVTEVWVDTDGEHVLINSVQGHVKVRNIARDPRVAVAIADPTNPMRYVQVRGRVLAVTTEGAVEHIERLAQKYLGTPYPWFGGRDQVRVIIVIEPERISNMR